MFAPKWPIPRPSSSQTREALLSRRQTKKEHPFYFTLGSFRFFTAACPRRPPTPSSISSGGLALCACRKCTCCVRLRLGGVIPNFDYFGMQNVTWWTFFRCVFLASEGVSKMSDDIARAKLRVFVMNPAAGLATLVQTLPKLWISNDCQHQHCSIGV
jgi:hypothetical protein